MLLYPTCTAASNWVCMSMFVCVSWQPGTNPRSCFNAHFSASAGLGAAQWKHHWLQACVIELILLTHNTIWIALLDMKEQLRVGSANSSLARTAAYCESALSVAYHACSRVCKVDKLLQFLYFRAIFPDGEVEQLRLDESQQCVMRIQLLHILLSQKLYSLSSVPCFLEICIYMYFSGCIYSKWLL